MDGEKYLREQKQRFDDFVARIILKRAEKRDPKQVDEEESLRVATESILLFANGEHQEPLASFEDPSVFDFKTYKPGAIFRTTSLSTYQLNLIFATFNRDPFALKKPARNMYNWYALGNNEKDTRGNEKLRVYQVCHHSTQDTVYGNQLKIGPSFFLAQRNISADEFTPSEWNMTVMGQTFWDDLFGKVETVDVMNAGKTSKVDMPELERGLRRLSPVSEFN